MWSTDIFSALCDGQGEITCMHRGFAGGFAFEDAAVSVASTGGAAGLLAAAAVV